MEYTKWIEDVKRRAEKDGVDRTAKRLGVSKTAVIMICQGKRSGFRIWQKTVLK